MALPLTQPSDYTGEIHISSNKYDKKELESYIARYELEILQDLLGCDLAAAFIADLDGNNDPVDIKFTEIFDAFCIDDDTSISFLYEHQHFYSFHPRFTSRGCNIQWKSRGILELLRYFVYLSYNRDQKIRNTSTGNVINDNEVSVQARHYETNMVRAYNSALDWYYAIQWRICTNPDDRDYDDYNGIIKEPIGLI